MFRTKLLLVAACLLLLVTQSALASRYAYIPRTGTNTVAVFDTQTNTVTANITLATGGQPWAVAVHPAGHRAYVARGSGSSLAVINTATNTVIANVTGLGTGVHHVAVTPDGSEVWTTSDNGQVSVISAASNSVIATLAGVTAANAIAFNPAGTRAYITRFAGTPGRIYVVNTATRALIATLTGVANAAEGIAVHPNGRYVYVTGNNASTVSILDTTTNTVTQSASIGSGVRGVAVHPNGRYYYVAQGSNNLRVLRASDNGVEATVSLGAGPFGRDPSGVHLSPTGSFVYVVNRNALNPSVTVVNTTTNAVVGSQVAINNAPVAYGAAIQRPLYGHGSIASGQYHSCRVRGDYSVDCWGRNDSGQATAPGGSFSQVVAGSAHSCGLRTDGTVTCWGNNTYGQTNAATGTFTTLSSGARHVCGVRPTGAVACWGENDQGQAGTPGGASNFVGIAAGSSHSCGLRSTGAISCWGRSADGQTVAPGGSYIQVVAGASFTCGLLASGSVSCWGDPTGGKTTPPLGAFAEISAESGYACGRRFDGQSACWGANTQGETLVPAGAHAQLAPGRFHGCSLQALGLAQCWGWNLYNQAPQFELNPLAVANGTVGQAYLPQTITMQVAVAGDRFPYAPRPTAYAVVAGTLPTGMSLSVGGALGGTPTAPGTFNFTVQGEDANGFTAQRAYTIRVSGVDSTPPVVTAHVTGTAGSNGWYRSNVTVTWTVTDPESQVGSAIGCGPATFTAETASTLVMCTATSLGGTTVESIEVKIDKTRPELAPSVSNTRPLLNEAITVSANATDALSGIASVVCDDPLTDTVSLAQKRINCTVTDEAGNATTKPAAYRVVYGFSGFTDTVLNPGWWNGAGLNQPITFKYRVVDANGTGIAGLAAPSFSSAALACPASVKQMAPVSAAAPGLVDLGDGNYEFTWVSPATASCVRMTLALGDGDHVKRVQFKFE